MRPACGIASKVWTSLRNAYIEEALLDCGRPIPVLARIGAILICNGPVLNGHLIGRIQ